MVLGGLAFAAYRIYLNEVEDSAVELVPPDAVFYANVYLNPSTRQKQALRDLLAHFPAADTSDEAKTLLEELLDDVLTNAGLEFAPDVEPWLGRQLAGYARVDDDSPDPIGAVLISTEDGDAAMEAVRSASESADGDLEPRSYKGFAYEASATGPAYGIVGDFLVIGATRREFEASVDASIGRSLYDTSEFRDATRALPADRIALFYLNISPYLDLLQEGGFMPGSSREEAETLFGSPGAAVAYLRPDRIVLETSSPGSRGGESGEVLAKVPASAWAGFAIGDLAGYVESRLEVFGPLGVAGVDVALQDAIGLDLQDDLLSWIGGAAFYLGDRSGELVVTAEVESRDPAKSAAALREIHIALIRQGLRSHPLHLGGLDGFRVEPRQGDDSSPPLFVLAGDRVIISNSRSSALEAVSGGDTLGDERVYSGAARALGSGFSPGLFVRVGSVLDVIGESVAEVSPDDASSYENDIKPDLEPFSFIIYGSRRDGDRTTGRLVIGVE